MCTVLVTYDPKNKVAESLMYALSQTKGVEIDEDAILAENELRRIEQVGKSGICTNIDPLQSRLNLPIRKRKRIPVSKVYWKKGDYKELVEDPFNLK